MDNEKVANDCIFCGGKARIIHFDDNMWYIQCSNISCKKHDKYAYLGCTKGIAIERWNYINRSTIQRKKNDKDNCI